MKRCDPVKVVNKWRIIISGDKYNAPEIRRFHLQGEATWVDPPVNKITSSPIISQVGNMIVTRSGSRYYLAEPENPGQANLADLVFEYPGIPLD